MTRLFSDLRVGAKVFIGYVIALALMAMVVVVAILRINQINATVTNLAERLAEEQHLADGIVANVWAIHFYALQYMDQQNQEDLDRYQAEFANFERLLTVAHTRISKDEQVTYLDNIKTGIQAYSQDFDAVIDLLTERNRDLLVDLDQQGRLTEIKLEQIRANSFFADDTITSYYAGNAQRALLLMRVAAFQYLESGDSYWIDEFNRAYENAQISFRKLDEEMRSPVYRELVQDAESTVDTYTRSFLEIQKNYARQEQLVTDRLNVVGPKIRAAGSTMSKNVAADFEAAAETTQALVARTERVLLITMGLTIVTALSFGAVISRSITRPLQQVTDVSRQIADLDLETLTTGMDAIAHGDLTRKLTITTRALSIESGDEIGQMARAFNAIITQLQKAGQAFSDMAVNLASLTRRLAMVAKLSEQLNAILDFDQLLAELVNQVKENFDYYHTHVYLLDEGGERLVMAAGTGPAGTEMKRQRHAIPLNTPTSLVARAARSGEVVRADNVLEAEDWLPNPLLPDTSSEMAIPIVREGKVVGVLDVQQNRIGSLDEGDANLLRSLAGHVAVALMNARLFAQTQGAKEAAEAASRAKSQFLSNMSHELRTPLSAILGNTQLLQLDKNLSLLQEERLAVIQQSGQHLLTLINDILDLAKIEAGRLELHTGPVHLPTFLSGVVSMMRIRAQQKTIRFGFEADPSLPAGIEADEKRLRQVLINLLGNAVKFTDAGQVSLHVSVLDHPPGLNGNGRPVGKRQTARTIRFKVTDTGIGIEPDQLAKIFEPFEQAGDKERRSEGTGLGLAISRQLVEAMGSELQVKSEVGRGSSFWFEVAFPLTATGQAEHPAGDEQPGEDDILHDAALVFPPPEEMLILFDLAMKGNMPGLRKRASQLEQMSPDYKPFAAKLEQLARSYKEDEILAMVSDWRSHTITKL